MTRGGIGIRGIYLLGIALLAFSQIQTGAIAAEPTQTILLWEQGAPGALGEEAKDKPTLIVYLPKDQPEPTAALVICPGGGYGNLAMDHEGHQIAAWANSLGMAGIICDYRHRGKGYGHPSPLQDAQRAIRLVRANSEQWNIDPSRVGIMGFSAGGHLASTVATKFDSGKTDSADAIDKQSCRPDFAILCYPVIAFDQPYTHKGSQRNLLGPDAAPELIASLSNESQVTAETPPTFLWHTWEDTAVPPENSIRFYLATLEHKVPAEIHVFAKGRHGVGLGKDIPGTQMWPELCTKWLESIGVRK